MALPASPPITLSDILTELGRYTAGQSLSGAADERSLSGVASGAISFSDYLGKSSFTLEDLGTHNSGVAVNIGAADDGRAIIIQAGGSGSAAISLATVAVGGTNVVANGVQQSVAYDTSCGGDCVQHNFSVLGYFVYTGSKTGSQPITISSTCGCGVGTPTYHAWRVVGYSGIHNTRNTPGNLTTVNGKAAWWTGTANHVVNPTDGTAISVVADGTSGVSVGLSIE